MQMSTTFTMPETIRQRTVIFPFYAGIITAFAVSTAKTEKDV